MCMHVFYSNSSSQIHKSSLKNYTHLPHARTDIEASRDCVEEEEGEQGGVDEWSEQLLSNVV